MSTKYKIDRDVPLDEITVISQCMSPQALPCDHAGIKDTKPSTRDLPLDDIELGQIMVGQKAPATSRSSTTYSNGTILNSEHYDDLGHKNHRPRSNQTYDNINRQELMWSEKIETIVKGWHNKCLKNANSHNECGKYQKKVFHGLGIPASVIPFILATMSITLTGDWEWVSTIGLIISGILSIVSGYLNPGGKSNAHEDFDSLYAELAVEITSELVKPQHNRQAADVFMQRIMDRYNNLNNRAPAT